MASLFADSTKMFIRLLIRKRFLNHELLSTDNLGCKTSSILGCPILQDVNVISKRHFNSNRAAICRIGRQVYTRLYPTLLVQPDGSTITIRYPLPQRIITLPIDITKMSEEERALHLLKRKPKQKVIIQEEIEDDFDPNQYSHLWKKK